MERTLSTILRGGVLISSLLISAGLIWMFGPSLGTSDSFHTASQHAPRAAMMLVNAGLIVLLSTPTIRVVASMLLFVRRQEWAFVAMTVWVLLAMAAGLVLAWY